MMDIQIEDVSSISKKLSFILPSDLVDAEIGKAYLKIAKTAKVKGFRKGQSAKAYAGAVLRCRNAGAGCRATDQ